jgi:hypothetical protein
MECPGYRVSNVKKPGLSQRNRRYKTRHVGYQSTCVDSIVFAFIYDFQLISGMPQISFDTQYISCNYSRFLPLSNLPDKERSLEN